MSVRGLGVAGALSALLLLSACHSMRFEIAEGPVGKEVYDRKSYFLDGLILSQNVDVSRFCPNGAVAIAEETTFVDGLINFVTLGIYSPRSSTYYCAADPQ